MTRPFRCAFPLRAGCNEGHRVFEQPLCPMRPALREGFMTATVTGASVCTPGQPRHNVESSYQSAVEGTVATTTDLALGLIASTSRPRHNPLDLHLWHRRGQVGIIGPNRVPTRP